MNIMNIMNIKNYFKQLRFNLIISNINFTRLSTATSYKFNYSTIINSKQKNITLYEFNQFNRKCSSSVLMETMTQDEKYKNEDKNNSTKKTPILIRLNRCLRPLTRALADIAIDAGKVTVNGQVAKLGMKVRIGDKVVFDGQKIDITVPNWNQFLHPFHKEENKLNLQSDLKLQLNSNNQLKTNRKGHFYIKVWKPFGVKCTTSKKHRLNLYELIEKDLKQSIRDYGNLYIVGNIETNVSGIVILTNDKRLISNVTAQEALIDSVYDITINGNEEKLVNQSASASQNPQKITATFEELVKEYMLEKKQQLEDKTISREQTNSNVTTYEDASSQTKSFQVITSQPKDNTSKEKSFLVHTKEKGHGNKSKVAAISGEIRKKATKVVRIEFAGITMKGLEREGSCRLLNHREVTSIKRNILGPYHKKVNPQKSIRLQSSNNVETQQLLPSKATKVMNRSEDLELNYESYTKKLPNDSKQTIISSDEFLYKRETLSKDRSNKKYSKISAINVSSEAVEKSEDNPTIDQVHEVKLGRKKPGRIYNPKRIALSTNKDI